MSSLMQIFSSMPVAFERGEGPYLFSTEGRRYLDFMSGVAVTGLGHCHPAMVKALTEQAGRLWHCSNQYQVPIEEQAAMRLVDNSFANAVFFCNSGAEANECGIKIIRKYFKDQGKPERYRIITMQNGFHGRTIGTISAGGQDRLTKGFEPVLDGFDRAPFGDIEALRAAITEQTAGIMLELIQGDGGIVKAPEGYFKAVRELADEHGLLLLLDEVQTGMGRTGRLFAYEGTEAEPDIMTLAKALGAGFPVAACLVNERANVLLPGSHGTTLGGNPLAMAVLHAILDEMLRDGFLEHVREMGALLQDELRELCRRYPKVLSEVRGEGLMIGVVCVAENETVLRRALDKGLLLMRGSGNVIRVLPSLIIEAEHIQEAISIFDAACRELQEGMAA